MKMAFDPHVVLPSITSPRENHLDQKDQNGLKRLCQDFESIFISSLFQQMRKSVPNDGYLEHETGMEMYQEIMDLEVAREMSRDGGFGLGQLLYQQLRGKAGTDHKYNTLMLQNKEHVFLKKASF